MLCKILLEALSNVKQFIKFYFAKAVEVGFPLYGTLFTRPQNSGVTGGTCSFQFIKAYINEGAYSRKHFSIDYICLMDVKLISPTSHIVP